MNEYRARGQQPVVIHKDKWETPLTVLSIAVALVVGIPVGKALWLALDAIYSGTWEVIGIAFIGILLLGLIAALAVGLFLWVRQPGQQLPGFMSSIERRIEQ